ncbi:ion channel protein [Demequina sp.]|uniref:ion channel protein n=1 Tax=Demequina sp. TaxID=2050685 RepID=UPI003D0D53B9
MTEDVQQGPTVRSLVSMIWPAVVIGVLSGLLMAGVNWVAGQLEDGLWDSLPDALGVDGSGALWIVAVLTATGIAVGIVVWLAPGHAGEDPAKTELVSSPLRLAALPGVAIALILGLAGGVSLGPENPIIAVAVGLSVWLAARITPKTPAGTIVIIATAGILGAMFGSPLAAALLLTEMIGEMKQGGPMWDKLFAPIIAASVGSVVTILIGESMTLPKLPAYTLDNAIDLVSALAVAAAAASLGVLTAIALPPIHRALHTLKHPVLYLGVGGLILGVLGAIGGPVTLFKGADQSAELVTEAATMSPGHLALVTFVKIAALLVAAGASFRGGRIFPSMFIGVALGLFINGLIPGIPVAIAVSCATLGFVLAISRSGWLAIFMAAALAGSVSIFGIICLAILPAWLVVTRAPAMIVKDRAPEAAPA